MSRYYSDPSRMNDPYALTDLEVWEEDGTNTWEDEDGHSSYSVEAGWYYNFCFPGCLPEGNAMGPYDSEAEALAAAREE